MRWLFALAPVVHALDSLYPIVGEFGEPSGHKKPDTLLATIQLASIGFHTTSKMMLLPCGLGENALASFADNCLEMLSPFGAGFPQCEQIGRDMQNVLYQVPRCSATACIVYVSIE